MEKILLSSTPEKQSHYCEVLEEAMLKNPNNWINYFEGPDNILSLNRIFGLSDRSRYYLGDPSVKSAEEKLLSNLSQVDIPLGLLHQFFPDQYRKVRENMISTHPAALLLDKICVVLDDYR
jgi:D-tagatose-1,6-bisphosphate aldolase subunit GatZ/KbaZ